MLFRAIASALLLLAVSLAHGQDAFVRDSFRTRTEKPANVESAWLDLRQTDRGQFETADGSRLGGSRNGYSDRSQGRRSRQDRISDSALTPES